MAEIVFFVAAIGALAGALAVVRAASPFYSVLWLVVHLISLAILFLALQAEFLAAAQLIVYAGAVMVLYVFVVSYVGGAEEPLQQGGAARALAPVFGVALALVLCLAVGGSMLTLIDTEGAKVGSGFGSPAAIGELLLTKFLLPFEVASFLLTVAAVAAVMLARRRRGLEPDDDLAASAAEGAEA